MGYSCSSCLKIIFLGPWVPNELNLFTFQGTMCTALKRMIFPSPATGDCLTMSLAALTEESLNQKIRTSSM